MKENKKLKVAQIKEIQPKADVYELNKFSRYIVMIEKSQIIGGNQGIMSSAQEIMKVMAAHGLPCAILLGVDDGVKFFELSGAKDEKL